MCQKLSQTSVGACCKPFVACDARSHEEHTALSCTEKLGVDLVHKQRQNVQAQMEVVTLPSPLALLA